MEDYPFVSPFLTRLRTFTTVHTHVVSFRLDEPVAHRPSALSGPLTPSTPPQTPNGETGVRTPRQSRFQSSPSDGLQLPPVALTTGQSFPFHTHNPESCLSMFGVTRETCNTTHSLLYHTIRHNTTRFLYGL